MFWNIFQVNGIAAKIKGSIVGKPLGQGTVKALGENDRCLN
jgi:hypothetical protein